jgi:hypothetical protein
MNRRDWYARVNAAWPSPLPQLTGPEAVKATRRLLRFCKVRVPPEITLTSGNRHTWIGGGVINPDRGWHTLVHSISHYAHRRRLPGLAPHDKSHARLELRLVKQVVKRGWLEGRLKPQPKPEAPAPAPSDLAKEKIDHAKSMLRRADTRLKRAETIRRKWARRVKRLLSSSSRPSQP